MPTTTQQLYALTAWEDIDGTTTVWNFVSAGGYIEQNDIKARYFLADGTMVAVPLLPANFTGPNQLTITPPIPATAVRFEVYRDTEKQALLVDFEDGNRITEAALNLSAKQATFVAVEAIDIATQAEANSKAAVSSAAAANATAAAAVVTANAADSKATTALEIAQDFLAGGSGGGGAIDAATLNGQAGGYYRDLANSLGTLPIARLTGTYDINVSGSAASLTTPRLINGVPFDGTADITISGGGGGSDTAAQILTKLLTVDGAASGLDADLLDGQHGSYYTDIVARLGFTPYNSTNPSGYQTAAQVTTSLASYLPLTGGTLTGNFNLFRGTGAALVTLRGSSTFGAGLYGQLPGAATNMFAIADRATAFGGTAGMETTLYTSAGIPLVFDVGAAERMRIEASTGSVSIGAITATQLLDVNGSTRVRGEHLVYSTTSDRLTLSPQTAGNGANIIAANNAGAAYAPLTLYGSTVALNTGGTERMRVDSAGNVGIGATSGGERLHIAGNIYMVRGAGATLRLADSNNEVRIASVPASGDSDMAFYTQGATNERLRITSAGAVVIAGSTVTMGGIEVGYRGVPTASVATGAFVAADRGKRVKATGAITIPNSVMADGDVVHVLNTTASAITVTKTITTAYNKNTGAALGATFTLAARGGMTIEFTSGTECYVGGNIS